MIRDAWAGLAPESLASTTQHVRERGFAETLGQILGMAREAGFQGEPRELFRDATGFHRLMVFVKATGT
jgi:hypothetical protein